MPFHQLNLPKDVSPFSEMDKIASLERIL